LSPPTPSTKTKDGLVLGLGVATIAFGFVWGVLLSIDDVASVLAGSLGMVAGVAMVLQSSRTMLYASFSLSAAAGVAYLFAPYQSSYVGSLLSFAGLVVVYAKRAVFQPAPRPRVPVYAPPTYPPLTPGPPSPPSEGYPQPRRSGSVYCPSCGNLVPSDSRFCSYCGRDLYGSIYPRQAG
jgi:hypothetical protein